MKIKAIMKVLATWIGIALLVIAYMIDKRSIIFTLLLALLHSYSSACSCMRCIAESWKRRGES